MHLHYGLFGDLVPECDFVSLAAPPDLVALLVYARLHHVVALE